MAKAAFSIKLSTRDTGVHVLLVGNGDMDAVPLLSASVSAFHSDARQHKAKVILFDLTRLYFLNRSCLKAFESLVVLDNELGPDKQYKIIFRLGLPWQHRAISILQALGRGLVIIEDHIDGTAG